MALQNNFLHNAQEDGQKLVTVFKFIAQGDKEVGQPE